MTTPPTELKTLLEAHREEFMSDREFESRAEAMECLRDFETEALAGTGAREAEGSGLLSRPASDGRAGSNPAPSVFCPPYRYEVSEHGPATIYDGIDVGWVARVKESLPYKAELARVIADALNLAAEREAKP